MAQQTGRLLLLKIAGADSPEDFYNLCGISTRNFRINNNLVDTSVPDCSSPGNTVAYTGEYGVQTLSFSGDGRFTDDADHTVLADAARQQESLDMQVVVPGWGTFEGSTKVTTYELGGEMEGTMTFSTEITMSGTITFTPEA